MGLDVTAYRQLKAEPNAQVDEEGNPTEWDNFVRITPSLLAYTEKEWPGRTRPLAAGIYSFADHDGFRAGSYGGYNDWRNWLAASAGYGSAQAVWNDITTGPFAELINFSDCEGLIGSVVCAKLAKDFAECEAAILATDQDDWYASQYRIWRQAFEMAADGGCVEFH